MRHLCTCLPGAPNKPWCPLSPRIPLNEISIISVEYWGGISLPSKFDDSKRSDINWLKALIWYGRYMTGKIYDGFLLCCLFFHLDQEVHRVPKSQISQRQIFTIPFRYRLCKLFKFNSIAWMFGKLTPSPSGPGEPRNPSSPGSPCLNKTQNHNMKRRNEMRWIKLCSQF